MENAVLRRGPNTSINFNNMTDDQLQEWRTAFLTEAQRENYVNHNLEIVRHYRTEAISRAPALDLERNAIDAAIARHGLCVSNAGTSESAACKEPAGVQDEVQPPPMRRPRMEQPQQPEQQNVADAPSGSGAAATENYGHYVALAHIFSDTYATRAEPPSKAAVSNGSASSSSSSNISNRNNNNEPENSDINNMAITKTIDSLGLRRI